MTLVPTKVRSGRTVMIVAVAGVYLVASASASLELVLRTHAICVQHGELVHLGHPAGNATSQVPTAPEEAGIGGQPAGDSGHEHCSLQSHRPGTALLPDRTAVPQQRVPPVLARVRIPVDEPANGIDVTGLAPKQSPPLV